MSKWFGKIGYAVTNETEPGIYDETILERDYYGDMTYDRRKRQASGGINDDISLANVISILADPFVVENCSHMAYAEIMGTRWKISEVEVQYPRLILTIGGVWNGNTLGASEQT